MIVDRCTALFFRIDSIRDRIFECLSDMKQVGFGANRVRNGIYLFSSKTLKMVLSCVFCSEGLCIQRLCVKEK